jgi:hypothetical protein
MNYIYNMNNKEQYINDIYNKLCIKLRQNKNNKGDVICHKFKDIISNFNETFIKDINNENKSIYDILDCCFNENGIPLDHITENNLNNIECLNLVGKVHTINNFNITTLLKRNIISLILKGCLIYYFINNDIEEKLDKNLSITEILKKYETNTKTKNEIINYIRENTDIINENNHKDDLLHLIEFFNSDKADKIGLSNYFEKNEYMFGKKSVNFDNNKDIDFHFTDNLNEKKNKMKEKIARCRIEVNDNELKIKNIKTSLKKVKDQLDQLDVIERDMAEELSSNKKKKDTSWKDVLRMIKEERDGLNEKEKIIDIRIDMYSEENLYLKSIINYHENRSNLIDENKKIIKLLLNNIVVSNINIDFFKEYFLNILELTENINIISKLEKKLSINLRSLTLKCNELNNHPLLQAIIKILLKSFDIVNVEHIYDHLHLIRSSIKEYDEELEKKIFEHPKILEIINSIKNIDKQHVYENLSKTEFFLEANHLNTSLILTIIYLINQEKNIGLSNIDEAKNIYFSLTDKINEIISQFNENYSNITSNYYIINNPYQIIKGNKEVDCITKSLYKKTVSLKHRYDSKLNQLKASLGLELKSAIDLKFHISNFIRYNYLFEEETADNSIVVKNEPIIMSLDQSLNGTTPVVFSEAVSRFYNEFKSKFISHEEFLKNFDLIKRQIEYLEKIKTSGTQGPEGKEGPRGLRGEIGPTGVQGIQGERGFRGEKGERGEKGDRGVIGEVGLRGEKGEDGIKGERGLQGEKGDRGDPFKYSDFTPEKLLELTGPRGEQGIKGDRGNAFTFNDFSPEQIDSLKGEKGEKGDVFKFEDLTDKQIELIKGPQGRKGERGIKGDKGESGEIDEITLNNIRNEMITLKKSVKEYVTSTYSKINKNIEKKLNNSNFKENLAEEISQIVMKKILEKSNGKSKRSKKKSITQTNDTESSFLNILDNFVKN